MGLLNYTTKIDPDKTAQEIAKCLSMHGATAVLTEYDPESTCVSAISFQIKLNDQKMGFRLPCDWKPVRDTDPRQEEALLLPDRQPQPGALGKRAPLAGRAHGVAHREGLGRSADGLVETQMVTTAEVFLPYAVMKDGRTLAQHAHSDPGFLFGDGTS